MKAIERISVRQKWKYKDRWKNYAIDLSNTTQSLAAALKDVQGLEAPEVKKKEKDAPAEAVVKAVIVSISTDVKMQIRKEPFKWSEIMLAWKETEVDQLAYLANKKSLTQFWRI